MSLTPTPSKMRAKQMQLTFSMCYIAYSKIASKLWRCARPGFIESSWR